MSQVTVDERQIRAARAFLGFSQAQVAKKAKCSHTVISIIEHGRNLPLKARVVACLEKLGIEFIEGGVRLR